MAVRTRPSAMRGRNIQYFRRMALMARSCSARSVRKRAVPLKVSPPMDSLICGVFCTLQHPLAIDVCGADVELVVIQNEPDRDFVGCSGLPTVMGQRRGLLSCYPLQSRDCIRFHKLFFGSSATATRLC